MVVVVVPVVVSGLIAAVASGEAVAVGLPAGVTVSVFCSQAASSAALARMQMYFFIVVGAYWDNCEFAASVLFGLGIEQVLRSYFAVLKWRLVLQAVGIGHRPACQAALARVNSTDESRLFLACAFEAFIREQLHIAIGHIR